MTTPKPPKDYGTNKLSLQPSRSYQLPGGPYAKSLGSVDVKVLAEIERGGDDDRGYGGKR
jgi:hypothetical protein